MKSVVSAPSSNDRRPRAVAPVTRAILLSPSCPTAAVHCKRARWGAARCCAPALHICSAPPIHERAVFATAGGWACGILALTRARHWRAGGQQCALRSVDPVLLHVHHYLRQRHCPRGFDNVAARDGDGGGGDDDNGGPQRLCGDPVWRRRLRGAARALVGARGGAGAAVRGAA